VRHLEAVGAALPAEDLPPGLGAQQEHVTTIRAVPAVEPVLDAFSHPLKLEQVF
jgi:hypothetical protein